MTLSEIPARLAAIAKEANDLDDEQAHKLEKALFVEVLETVAKEGDPHVSALAREALKARDIAFDRYFS